MNNPKSPQTPSNEEFMECDTCRAKVGAPILCGGCVHNRNLIMTLINTPIPTPTKPDISLEDIFSEYRHTIKSSLGQGVGSEGFAMAEENAKQQIQTLISSKETEARVEEADWWNVQSGYLAKYLIDNRQNASALVQQEMADRIKSLTGGQIDA